MDSARLPRQVALYESGIELPEINWIEDERFLLEISQVSNQSFETIQELYQNYECSHSGAHDSAIIRDVAEIKNNAIALEALLNKRLFLFKNIILQSNDLKFKQIIFRLCCAALTCIDPNLKEDKKFVDQITQKMLSALRVIEKEDMDLIGIFSDAFMDFSADYKGRLAIDNLKEFTNYKPFAMAVVKNNPESFKRISKVIRGYFINHSVSFAFKKDVLRFIVDLVRENIQVLKNCCPHLQEDPDFMFHIIERYPFNKTAELMPTHFNCDIFGFLVVTHEQFLAYRPFAIEMLKKNKWLFKKLKPLFRGYFENSEIDVRYEESIRTFILEAIHIHTYAIRFCCDKLKSDPDFMLIASTDSSEVFGTASEDLRGLTVKTINELLAYKPYLIRLIKANPAIIAQTVVKIWLDQCYFDLEPSKMALHVKALLLELIQETPEIIMHLSCKFDKEFMEKAIKRNRRAILYADDQLQNDSKLQALAGDLNQWIKEFNFLLLPTNNGSTDVPD